MFRRGASDSNLQISFNIVPRWKLETADAGTTSVTKEWKDADGNAIDDASGYPNVTMGLFGKTSTEAITRPPPAPPPCKAITIGAP